MSPPIQTDRNELRQEKHEPIRKKRNFSWYRAGAYGVMVLHSTGVTLARLSVDRMLSKDELKPFRENLPFEWISSDWLCLGKILGCILSGPCLSFLGRKSSLQLVALPLLLTSYAAVYFFPKLVINVIQPDGYSFDQTSPNFFFNSLFTAVLMFQGLGEGLTEVCQLIYCFECVVIDPWGKDSLGPAALFSAFQMPKIASRMFYVLFGPTALLRVVPVLVLMVTMFLYTPLKESDRFLNKRKRDRRRNSCTSESTVGCLGRTTGGYGEGDQSSQEGCEFWLRPFLVSCGILLLSKFSGRDVYKFYSSWTFRFAGIKGVEWSGEYGELVSSLLGFLTVIVGSFICLFSKGPTAPIWLLAISTGVITGCLVTTGTILHVLEQGGGGIPYLLPLLLYLVQEVFQEIGLSPVSLVAVGFVCPPDRRPSLLPFLVSLRGGSSHLSSRTLPLLLESLHPFGVFWFFASLTGIGFLYSAAVVGPEMRLASSQESRDPWNDGETGTRRRRRSKGSVDLLRMAPLHPGGT